jgi:PIN domain-containing protein
MRKSYPGYYRPTKSDFETLWAKGIFAFDANVLLGVYRYSVPTRDNLLSVLEGLKERIWLPYQAGLEFHRNRLAVITAQEKLFDDARDALKTEATKLEGHTFLDAPVVAAFKKQVGEALDSLKKARESHADLFHEDPLRDRLTALFEGRVGQPYDAEKLKTLEATASARIGAKVPPGYEDAGKKDSRQYGDVILWFQLVDQAKATKTPLLFVTDERKDDWWFRHSGQTVGPRPELIEEFQREAGVPFYMYRPDQFLEHAQSSLNLKNPAAVDEVRGAGEQAGTTATVVDSALLDRIAESIAAERGDSIRIRPSPKNCRVLLAILDYEITGLQKRVPLVDIVSRVVGRNNHVAVLAHLQRRGWITDVTPGWESGRLSKRGRLACQDCMAARRERRV